MQPLACFFGRRKTSEAGQYRRGWLAKRSARLSFLSKRSTAPWEEAARLFFRAEKDKQCRAGTKRTARQSNALACLFYLKERDGLPLRKKSRWEIKKSPAISDGGSEATFKGKLRNHRLPRLKQTHRRQYKD